MKSLLFIALVLGGCAAPRQYTQLTDQFGEPGISRFENKESVCYVYTDKQDKSDFQCKWKVSK